MNTPVSYEEFAKEMISLNYRRVERDDRLLDILSNQTREKGVELWEKAHNDNISIIRLRLPYSPEKIKTYSISRSELETALRTNTNLNLKDFIKTS